MGEEHWEEDQGRETRPQLSRGGQLCLAGQGVVEDRAGEAETGEGEVEDHGARVSTGGDATGSGPTSSSSEGDHREDCGRGGVQVITLSLSLNISLTPDLFQVRGNQSQVHPETV